MVFITGDIHGDALSRFNMSMFPDQVRLCKSDYVIICGDFGVIWDNKETPQEKYVLDWLEKKSFTTLFVDGNHENFDRLYDMPVATWHGGNVHALRPSVLHLMRGQIYDIDNASFFTFGGARSHDIRDGILQPGDPRLKSWEKDLSKSYRVEGVSWWSSEMPSQDEMDEGIVNLRKHGDKVDYIITHDMASSDLARYSAERYCAELKPDKLNDYLEELKSKISYNTWFCGHHHDDCLVGGKLRVVYRKITQIGF